jgi:hypothetical protein
MSWCVMQTELDPPPAEQLKIAFAQVPELTALDAANLGRDSFGVLARGFEQAQAEAMRAALAEQGSATEVVQESSLPELPPPQKLSKVEFTPDALCVDNLMGRVVQVPWAEILLIAAGRIRLTEFVTELEDKICVGSGKSRGLEVRTESSTREQRNEHLLLEVITRGAAQRFNTVADNPETALLFQCLGEQRSRVPAANLCLLVRELSKSAPNAILNHGAFFMRENNDAGFLYPSKGAFYREITWLFWMVATGRARR